MSRVSPQERILGALQGGLRTWNDLKELTKINDERLGFTLGELLDLRKIWTAQKNDVRVYGIERRVGLVPRFHNLRRRSTDK
ncbi:MAG TPA: hypothetical protein VEV81_07270 [Pyrinomonadaceae bacterium]|nr:hypothetical protein [Pyrinomonadaceae bacterium]